MTNDNNTWTVMKGIRQKMDLLQTCFGVQRPQQIRELQTVVVLQ